MSEIPLQAGIVYGPILSRRLGRSLGINLLPLNRKVCSFDCIYCQYGSENVTESRERGVPFPTVSEVLTCVESALRKPRTIDYLTFSGNGEPTLHPEFPDIVKGVLSLRNDLRPQAKLAILSNSSQVNDPEILSALQLLDVPMMKLDAGDEKTFEAINRQAKTVEFAELVNGLKRIKNLVIQSLLIDGVISNTSGDAFDAWVETLVDLQPCEIHIYSIDRPTPVSGILAVNADRLEKIACELQKKYFFPVKAFW
jgi:wyosine [tRNA(Phe)-imidazoG37] synthetase (radical SAM superfamily)